MKFAYVLPDPASYADRSEFDADLACMRDAGYDAVEVQIADPAELDEPALRRSLEAVGYDLCAFQTGSTYASRGNCLSTPDEAVRERTIGLLRSFVDLAARWRSVIVFGSLQGRLSDSGDRQSGQARIRDAVAEIGRYASERQVTLAFEPVNHLEVGFNHTIAAVEQIVRELDLPGLRMMVDAFHMNIEESDMLAPLARIADVLAHVHLSETNRDLLGSGHWPTAAFLRELERIGYQGFCSIGVYNTQRPRSECIRAGMEHLRGNASARVRRDP